MPHTHHGALTVVARHTCCLAAVLGLSSHASAQDARKGELGVQRFEPAPGPNNFVTVASARTEGDPALWGGVVVGYARDPFRLRHCEPGPCDEPGSVATKVPVVRDLATAHFVGALTIIPRFQLGVRLPFHYVAGEGIDTDRSSPTFGRGQIGGLSGGGPGDPAFEVKFRALGDLKSKVAAGGAVWATAPLGKVAAPQKFFGESAPGVGVKAIADARFGKVALGVNLGAFFRERASLGSLDLGPEGRLALAASYDLMPNLAAIAEVFGNSNLSTAAGTNAAEADLSVKYRPSLAPVNLVLGGGAGLNQGLGAPLFRGFGGIEVTVAQLIDRPADTGDRDGDGVADAEDQCPTQGGDVVREAGSYLGCPWRDSDGDGVADALDACPEQTGVASSDRAKHGCPDPDRDHDGIPNERDRCPDAAEVVNGVDDDDGCPDKVPIKIDVRGDELVIGPDRVAFDPASDAVGAAGLDQLGAIADVLKQHPEFQRIEIAGHADPESPRAAAQALSERRAAGVVAHLVARGVAADRLVARGYGGERPLSREKGAAAARNHRVELRLLVIAK